MIPHYIHFIVSMASLCVELNQESEQLIEVNCNYLNLFIIHVSFKELFSTGCSNHTHDSSLGSRHLNCQRPQVIHNSSFLFSTFNSCYTQVKRVINALIE